MRAALALLLVCLLAPAAVALPELTGEEIVHAHSVYEFSTGHVCSSYDPALGIVSTDLTSRLAHTASGDVTSYTLSLDGTPGDATCPAWSLTFDSDLAWPTSDVYASGSVLAACGASGVLTHMPSSGSYFGLFLLSTPSECALPFSAPAWIGFSIRPVTSDASLCTPIVFAACTGAQESSYPFSCSGTLDRFSVVVAGFEVVYGQHGCDWMTMEEYGQVGDGFGLLYVRGTASSCTVVVGDGFGVGQSAPCPEPVGDAIYEQDWLAVLP